MNSGKIKRVRNIDNGAWITYFSTADGFDYETATEITNTLIKNYQVKTYQVYTILFFGYEHKVLTEDIKQVNECLETFTKYKLALTEIEYSANTQEITFLFE